MEPPASHGAQDILWGTLHSILLNEGSFRPDLKSKKCQIIFVFKNVATITKNVCRAIGGEVPHTLPNRPHGKAEQLFKLCLLKKPSDGWLFVCAHLLFSVLYPTYE